MRTLLLPLAAWLTACSGTTSSPEAGDGGFDASSASPDAGALVAECQSLASTFVSHCYNEYTGDALTPDTERVCIWTAYGHLCQTGNTKLLLDSMRCFGQNPSCWTFSDPNSAASCLAAVHAAEPQAQVGTFLDTVCTQCGGTSCDAGDNGQGEFIPYISSQELSALEACWGGQCSNAGVASSCASLPEIGIFNCK